MNAPVKQKHPSRKKLAEFARGDLPEESHSAVELHVAECEQCCQVLQQVPSDRLMKMLRQDQTPNGKTEVDLGNTPPAASIASQQIPFDLINHPRYRIVRPLGAGGMGVVYQAEHRLMERTVALKVINQELLQSTDAVERFRREVKAAARLNHPNIVSAHDAEQAGHLHFLVMEYVDGMSLSEFVRRRGPLQIPLACHYIRQIALALEHAHQQGMVHRDIKPQNLMVTGKGQIKVLDFGLARFSKEVASETHIETSITQMGMVVGTPDYISPEQAQDSSNVDIRTDIYSLGCTFYYLLTGRVPFPSGTVSQKMVWHCVKDPEPASDFCTQIPAELNDILDRMMAKSPEERFATPDEVSQALRPWAKKGSVEKALAQGSPLAKKTDDETTVLESPSTIEFLKKHHFPLIAGAATVLTCLILWGIFLLLRPPVSPGENHSLTGTPGQNNNNRVSGENTEPPLNYAYTPLPRDKPRVLVVLPFEQFWYPDYEPIPQKFKAKGVGFSVASTKLGQATPHKANQSPSVHVDLTLDRVNTDDFDVVMFLGGNADEFIGENMGGKQSSRIIHEMIQQGKKVTSLGLGTAALLNAQVLNHQEAAYTEYLKPTIDRLYTDKVKWNSKQAVVYSGQIVTGRDWDVAEEFAEIVAHKAHDVSHLRRKYEKK